MLALFKASTRNRSYSWNDVIVLLNLDRLLLPLLWTLLIYLSVFGVYTQGKAPLKNQPLQLKLGIFTLGSWEEVMNMPHSQREELEAYLLTDSVSAPMQLKLASSTGMYSDQEALRLQWSKTSRALKNSNATSSTSTSCSWLPQSSKVTDKSEVNLRNWICVVNSHCTINKHSARAKNGRWHLLRIALAWNSPWKEPVRL